ncbi:hypothetical protein [Aureibacter tunicatorum]|uniref:Uncharacterized protein n=1 Tax=Aureibacter tunicatorum TaxID=866807 RepID=A0AAE3XQ10_9BACT|nr:hypothetical protein [Aureibacter tunicatorum]MDR6239940.1 hypothetical protein [Aureibacter tunicatorum]BDD04414.1 hypothetical protein AUTU_18970 [Aureibacter tunicatorum]
MQHLAVKLFHKTYEIIGMSSMGISALSYFNRLTGYAYEFTHSKGFLAYTALMACIYGTLKAYEAIESRFNKGNKGKEKE